MTPAPFQIERILCPTDFSVFSSRAFRHAVALARQFRAELTAFHVIPTFSPYGARSPYFPAPVGVGPALRQEVEEEMGRFVEPALEIRLPVQTLIREGQPAQEIQALAEELPADIVVMGTHGRSGFERLVLGSVAEKLVHRLPCPVLTVCHEEGRTWEAPGLVRRILCATDFSDSSARTVAFALSLAAADQAQVTLLHAIEALPEAGVRTPRFPEGLRRELEQMAREQLHQLVPEEARAAGNVEERVTAGRAYQEILRIAAMERVDLIVMGTQGHGPLGRMILGSTAHHVVRQATCPVLIVRPRRLGQKARHTTTALAVS
jgi:nucleotide-binding universal stress UspA family protein